MRRDRRRKWMISSFPMRRHNRHVVRNQETKRVQRSTSRIRARPRGTKRMRGRSHEKPSEQNSPNRVMAVAIPLSMTACDRKMVDTPDDTTNLAANVMEQPEPVSPPTLSIMRPSVSDEAKPKPAQPAEPLNEQKIGRAHV